jgi:arylsulfatase A-like enzyme
MIIAGSRIQSGSTHESPVSLIDLTATFRDITQSEPLKNIAGTSLVPVLTKSKIACKEYAFSGLGAWRLVTDRQYKPIVGFDENTYREDIQYGKWQGLNENDLLLFDTKNDPVWSKYYYIPARFDPGYRLQLYRPLTRNYSFFIFSKYFFIPSLILSKPNYNGTFIVEVKG